MGTVTEDPFRYSKVRGDLRDHGSGAGESRRAARGFTIPLRAPTGPVRIKEKAERLVLRFFPRILYPPLTPTIYFQRRSFPRNRFIRLIYSAFVWNYELVILERIVEIPFVFQNLGLPKGAKILDFGCSESPVSLHLASLGYRVVCVDLCPYPFTHPNLQFVQGDFLECGFLDSEFDAVIAISAVEHCGLGAYGDKPHARGDEEIIREMFRILRPAGRLLITVPYGWAGATSWYRVYDRTTLASLLRSFKIAKAEYYVGMNRKVWRPAGEEELAEVDSVGPGFPQGVACVLAVKS